MRLVPGGFAGGANVSPQHGTGAVAPLVLELVAPVDLLWFAVVLAELALDAHGRGWRRRRRVQRGRRFAGGRALQERLSESEPRRVVRRSGGSRDGDWEVALQEHPIEVSEGSRIFSVGVKVCPEVGQLLPPFLFRPGPGVAEGGEGESVGRPKEVDRKDPVVGALTLN